MFTIACVETRMRVGSEGFMPLSPFRQKEIFGHARKKRDPPSPRGYLRQLYAIASDRLVLVRMEARAEN
jgi:hypothetical protein